MPIPAGNWEGQELLLGYRELMEGSLGFYGIAFHGFWCNSDQYSTHRLPVSQDLGSCFIHLKISAICDNSIKVINQLIFFNGCWTLKPKCKIGVRLLEKYLQWF